MRTDDDYAEDPRWRDPLPVLRTAREQLVTYGRLQDQLAAGARRDTEDPRDFEREMSPGLRALVERYRRDNPDVDLQLLAYTRSLDGRVELMLSAGRKPPGERHLVQLTSATSVVDTDRLTVLSEVLFAARRSGAAGG